MSAQLCTCFFPRRLRLSNTDKNLVAVKFAPGFLVLPRPDDDRPFAARKQVVLDLFGPRCRRKWSYVHSASCRVRLLGRVLVMDRDGPQSIFPEQFLQPFRMVPDRIPQPFRNLACTDGRWRGHLAVPSG